MSMDTSPGEVTRLLADASQGNREALSALMPLIYEELRAIAARHLRAERPNHTLQTTGLVHEAYLRLIDQNQTWQNRAHFFAIAAMAMRRILVDYARASRAEKRGGQKTVLPLEEALVVAADESWPDLIELDWALSRLAKIDERMARLVELRFFGGLTVEETAAVLGISPRTIKREWRVARAWLRREITGTRHPADD
jgi:RNA polymerase sigma factor (TIGR02999 family)